MDRRQREERCQSLKIGVEAWGDTMTVNQALKQGIVDHSGEPISQAFKAEFFLQIRRCPCYMHENLTLLDSGRRKSLPLLTPPVLLGVKVAQPTTSPQTMAFTCLFVSNENAFL